MQFLNRLNKSRGAIVSASVLNAFTKAAGWLISIYLASHFLIERNVDDLALFLILQSGAMVGALLDMGACAMFVEYGALGRQTQSNLFRKCTSRILRGVFTASVVTGAIYLYLLFTENFNDLRPIALLFCCLLFTGSAQIVVLLQKVQALELMEYKTSIATLLSSCLATLSSVYLISATNIGSDVIAVVYVLILWITQTLMVVWNLGILRITSLFKKTKEDQNDTNDVTANKYGEKFTIVSVTSVLGNAIDVVLIGAILQPIDVARYGIAYRLFVGVQAAQLSVNQLWPIVATKWAQGSEFSRRRILQKLYGVSTSLAIVMSLVALTCVVHFKNIPGLVSVEFSMSELTGLVLFSVSSGIGGISAMLAYRSNMIKGLLKIQIVWAIAMVSSKFLAGNLYGLNGFIWSIVVINILCFHIPIIIHLLNTAKYNK